MLKTNISHLPITEKPTHITYRLFGSIPQSFVEQATKKRNLALEKLTVEVLKFPKGSQQVIYDREAYSINAQFELALDQALHGSKDGPFFLQESAFREIILGSWLFLQSTGIVVVVAICVMGNHVHIILRTPDDAEPIMPRPLMQRHKRHTARTCNKLLKVIDTPFWDKNYYDREIRKGKFMQAVWYVLNNPVKAELVKNWKNWRGTYLNPEYAGLFES